MWTYEGQSNEKRTPATKWQLNLFYSKAVARSIITLIPLWDEAINSSFVGRGRSLMDPQPHPLMHFLVRMKPTPTNVCLQVAKKCGSHKGKDLGCTEDVEVFPSKISPDWQYGDGRYHAKGWFCPTAFQGVEPYATKKRTTPLCSSLLASISNAGRTHFTLRAPPEQQRNNCVYLCISLCMSPTLQMAVSIRNNSVASFCEECALWRVFGFHLTAPYNFS